MKLTETYTSLTQTHIKFDIYQPNVILRYKGIIQLHHGLCEHSDRYQKFAEYLIKFYSIFSIFSKIIKTT